MSKMTLEERINVFINEQDGETSIKRFVKAYNERRLLWVEYDVNVNAKGDTAFKLGLYEIPECPARLSGSYVHNFNFLLRTYSERHQQRGEAVMYNKPVIVINTYPQDLLFKMVRDLSKRGYDLRTDTSYVGNVQTLTQ